MDQPKKGTFFILLLLTLSGCALFNGQDETTLSGSYTDYSAYLNAELAPFPSGDGRYIHFKGTPYVVSASIDCETLPVDSVTAIELLKIPDNVDTKEWIQYHHADFGNDYTDIEPEKFELLSGKVDLKNVKVEQQNRQYGDEQITLQVLFYKLHAQELSFENNIRVPSIITEEHRCYSASK